ncbi:MAG: T9SS type A sorting domain-containing protein [Bacteroidales bacterium]|jgi:hypothetical protein|nr:T9SS type A sorting domain-containing protein [Bacteroidales bacterium]
MKIRKILLMTVLALSSLSMIAQNENWIQLGPDNVSGRVRSVIFDKFNDGVMYAGGVAGGFFISVNDGMNWQEIALGTGESASTAVTAITQSEDGTIYVGTGESYYNAISTPGLNNNVSGMLGNGVYKLENWSNTNWAASLATDEDKYNYAKTYMHFVQLASTKPVKYDLDHEWAYVNDLLCVGNTIYAGLTKNLKYSNDGGATWQNATVGGSSTSPLFINDIKVNKGGRIAVAYGVASGTGGGSNVSDYKVAINTADNPTTFINILTPSDLNITNGSFGRIELSFGINNPNTLYAAVGEGAVYNGQFTPMLGVFRTKDLDNPQWTAATTSSDAGRFGVEINTALCVFVDDRGYYEKVYVGSSQLDYGYDNNNVGGTGIYLWTSETSPYSDRNSGQWVGNNIHNIIVKDNPKNRMDSLMIVLATDEGVIMYKATTPFWTTDTCTWQLSSKGMDNIQFYDVAVASDGSVFGAAQSNAIVYIGKANDDVYVNTDDEIKWTQKNNDTIVVDGVSYYVFNSDNYTISIDGDTLTISYKTNINGDIIWAPNSPGYADIMGDLRYYENVSGSSVVASGFAKLAPNVVKPAVVTRPTTKGLGTISYPPIARTYSNNNSYYELNNTTWNYRAGEGNFLPPYFTPSQYDPFNMPMCLWESTTANTIKDSVETTIDIHTIINGRIGGTSAPGDWKPGAWILPGDSILVKSSAFPLSYPFYHTLTDSIQLADTAENPVQLKVQNPIQSRLFIANASGVYACTGIIDFSKYYTPQPIPQQLIWANVFPISNSQSQKVHCMAVSNDGDALLIAIEEGQTSVLVRVRGLLDAKLDSSELSTGMWYNAPTLYMPNPLTIDTIYSASRIITSIAIDQRDANNVILTFGGFDAYLPSVMLSTNALAATGVAFNDITGVDPNTADPIPVVKPVFASVIESMNTANAHKAYIGSEDGVWVTNDFTSNPVEWSKCEAIPNVPVYKLIQQTRNLPYTSYPEYTGNVATEQEFEATKYPGAVYAATYGKGLYACYEDTVAQKSPVVSLGKIEGSEPNVSISFTVSPNPAQGSTNLNYVLPVDSKVSFKLYDINGRQVSSMERGSQRAGQYNVQLDCQSMRKGIYMVQIITEGATKTAKLIVQ